VSRKKDAFEVCRTSFTPSRRVISLGVPRKKPEKGTIFGEPKNSSAVPFIFFS
jgi:hypothetical protein